VRVVYVVLEAQYQSSLSAAVRSLNGKRTDVAYEVRRAAVTRPRGGH
jgi:magnesium chelatase subunit H